MTIERHKIRAASYLLLLRKNEILLSRRFNTGWEDGKYSLVSGHIDGRESFKTAMCREAYEETGISINSNDLKFVHATHRGDLLDKEEYIDIFFACTKWNGEVVNKEPDKCDEIKWFALDKLPGNIIPSVEMAIENYMKGSYYSEIGWG